MAWYLPAKSEFRCLGRRGGAPAVLYLFLYLYLYLFLFLILFLYLVGTIVLQYRARIVLPKHPLRPLVSGFQDRTANPKNRCGRRLCGIQVRLRFFQSVAAEHLIRLQFFLICGKFFDTFPKRSVKSKLVSSHVFSSLFCCLFGQYHFIRKFRASLPNLFPTL